jgi:hypothetical protein
MNLDQSPQVPAQCHALHGVQKLGNCGPVRTRILATLSRHYSGDSSWDGHNRIQMLDPLKVQRTSQTKQTPEGTNRSWGRGNPRRSTTSQLHFVISPPSSSLFFCFWTFIMLISLWYSSCVTPWLSHFVQGRCVWDYPWFYTCHTCVCVGRCGAIAPWRSLRVDLFFFFWIVGLESQLVSGRTRPSMCHVGPDNRTQISSSSRNCWYLEPSHQGECKFPNRRAFDPHLCVCVRVCVCVCCVLVERNSENTLLMDVYPLQTTGLNFEKKLHKNSQFSFDVSSCCLGSNTRCCWDKRYDVPFSGRSSEGLTFQWPSLKHGHLTLVLVLKPTLLNANSRCRHRLSSS